MKTKPAPKRTRRKPSKKAQAAAKGKRYTSTEKAAVLQEVDRVNALKGRGGIAAASRKFGISPLTVSNWLSKAGHDTSAPRTNRDKPSNLEVEMSRLVEIDTEMNTLREERNALASSIKSQL